MGCYNIFTERRGKMEWKEKEWMGREQVRKKKRGKEGEGRERKREREGVRETNACEEDLTMI